MARLGVTRRTASVAELSICRAWLKGAYADVLARYEKRDDQR
jgi:hypothetical protein